MVRVSLGAGGDGGGGGVRQVTNPAIDPLRESIVMSLEVHLGAKGNAVEGATEAKAGLIKLESPLLNDGEIQTVQNSGRASKTLSTLYEVSSGPAGLRKAVEALCQQAEAAVRAGAEILVLSDLAKGGITAEKTYIPPLLAVGAVHHHLLGKKLRLRASLVSQTAQCWSTHHFACLLGFGASAVHPYAALEAVRSWYYSAKTKSLMEQGKIPSISVGDALDNYRESVDAGLLKIMSKIGISLLSSYHAAQIFEAIGVGRELIDLGFRGTVSRVGGLTVEELANEVNSLHRAGFPETPLKNLQNYGFVKYYTGKEYHHNSPPLTKLLHKALETKDVDSYKLFQESLRTAPLSTLRDLLDIKSDREPIPLDQVQPLEDIVRRFCTGGMSLGALSREAHETLAISMNRFGGKSNSGEGGEDVLRYSPITDVDADGRSPTFPHLKGLRNGDLASSKIKQAPSHPLSPPSPPPLVAMVYLFVARVSAEDSIGGARSSLLTTRPAPSLAAPRPALPGIVAPALSGGGGGGGRLRAGGSECTPSTSCRRSRSRSSWRRAPSPARAGSCRGPRSTPTLRRCGCRSPA